MFLYENSPDILKIFWTKNEQKLDQANDGRFSEVSIYDPSLTIRDVKHDDAGEYRLNATNAVGTTRSEVIFLGILILNFSVLKLFYSSSLTN